MKNLASAPPAASPWAATKPQPRAPSAASNTPYKTKLASNPSKGAKAFKKATMDPMLKDEIGPPLKDVSAKDLLTFLFPGQYLQASSLFTKLSAGGQPLYADGEWVDCPDLSKPSQRGDVERDLVAFLQKLGKHVADLTGDAPKRTWSARNATDAVEHAPNTRYPDLLLSAVDTIGWGDADGHGELKCSPSTDNQDEAYRQLLNGAYLIFSSQDNRRFVVSLCFLAHTLQLHIFDRSGLVTSSSFDIHKEPRSFIHLITALMFVDDTALLGYDTSIIERDGSRFITVGATEYQIVKTLFVSDVIRGRGTVCWHARHGDEDFVIKDTWADDSREHSEAEILRKAAGVKGVPQVVADVVVRIHGAEDSTANLRSPSATGPQNARLLELLEKVETRIHRRLVITPLCSSLPNFANRRELLSIFIDVVTAHRDLCEKKRIVHRDISVNNLMIVPHPTVLSADQPQSFTDVVAPAAHASPATASAPRRGIIIDFDYALITDPEDSSHKVAIGHRTGTLPFMAIQVLRLGGRLRAHEPKHDLESMLYVLIWVCVLYTGPGDVERQNFDITDSEMAGWVQGGDYKTIGSNKSGTIFNPEVWKDFLEEFAPYFHPLKTCVTAWKDLLITGNMGHDAVLQVLRTGLEVLPEGDEKWSRKNDPEGYGPETGEKRKRQHDFLTRINDAQSERSTKFLNSGDGGRLVTSAPAIPTWIDGEPTAPPPQNRYGAKAEKRASIRRSREDRE